MPEPLTIHEGIRALPAGGSLWVDENGVFEPRIWLDIADLMRVAASNSGAGLDDADCAVALGDSARAHLEADVPVGMFLSSGIDSTALLGLVRAARPESSLQSVTLGFEEFRGTGNDETPWARRIAHQYASSHYEHYLSRTEFEADVPRFLAAMDQPSIDGANAWFVSKVAAQAGLKVALSGIGGDELFGGYPSFEQIPQLARILAVPGRLPVLGTAFERLHRSLSEVLPAGSPKWSSLLRYGGSIEGAYFLRRAVFMPWELPDLVGREMAVDVAERFDPVAHVRAAAGKFAGSSFAHVAALESSLYLRNQLLRDADWAGMAHGVEIRLPLVDVFLLRRLAPRLGQTNGMHKGLLAQAPEPALPAALQSRPKTGFVLPMEDWLSRSRRLDDWRRVRRLRRANCSWGRRWAYTVLCHAYPQWEGLQRAA